MTNRPPALSSDLAHLDDAQLHAEKQARYAALHNCAAREEVKAYYESSILPIERELVWRAGEQDPNAEIDLLFITVGAQHDTPINAGLRWRAKHVVLLHSDEMRKPAVTASEALGLGAANGALESVGDGGEATRLYRKLYQVWTQHGQPAKTYVDLTGGFKTMSAAAGAAAFVAGMKATYVHTHQERLHGQQVWLDTEVRLLENPLETFGDIKRKVAVEFLQSGQFTNAERIYAELEREVGRRPDGWRRTLSAALAASARMDMPNATTDFNKTADTIDVDTRNDDRLATDPLVSCVDAIRARAEGTDAVQHIVAANKADQSPSVETLSSPQFLDFIEYLLARARERKRHQEYDFAALFGFRALEAVTQRRLAHKYHYNTSNFDWDQLAKDAGKSKSDFQDKFNRRHLSEKVDKGLANRILAQLLEDDLLKARSLKKLDGIGEARNHSVLVHGTQQVSEKLLNALLEAAEEMFAHLLELEGLSDAERAALKLRHAPIDLSA